MTFDLSAIVFIATANQLEAIPGPLRDRMEMLELAGYTEAEKAQIARRYLLPRQLEACGLAPAQCELTDEALAAIIRDYTREAGVRSLERQIGAVLRHVAMLVAEDPAIRKRIGSDDLAVHPGASPLRERIGFAYQPCSGGQPASAWTPVGR
ncbi:hypothetical protein ACU4GD_00090 [Cupriavidus basilensis]